MKLMQYQIMILFFKKSLKKRSKQIEVLQKQIDNLLNNHNIFL